MKYLVDAHFPKRLKHWLLNNGEDAIHTSDLEKGNASTDLEIIRIADKESRVIISKARDFYE